MPSNDGIIVDEVDAEYTLASAEAMNPTAIEDDPNGPRDN